MAADGSLFFYWLIAAVVLAPIVLIVKGIAAGKRRDEPESRETSRKS